MWHEPITAMPYSPIGKWFVMTIPLLATNVVKHLDGDEGWA